MGWKNLTFVLIPHSQSKVKQYKVNRFVLYGAALFLIVAVAVMIFYIVGFQRKSYLLSSRREIERQNVILSQVVSELDSSITMLTEKIDSLENIAEQTRLEAEISDRDLKLTDASETYLAGDGQVPLRQLLASIDRLERRSYAFAYNFGTMYENSIEDSTLLARIPSIRPSSGYITKDFNWLDRDETLALADQSHPGVSITDEEGTPIYATAAGTIVRIETTDDLGRYIEIDHGNGYHTRYAHLQTITQMEEKIRWNTGDTVTRGQQIATMGRTGISIQAIAPHVLYTVEYNGTYVNPNDYFFASDTTTPLPLGMLLAQP